MSSNKIWVIIPAAGVGKRMQTDIPKQYLTLHGRTVLEHTLDCFMHHPAVAGVVIALHPEDPYWAELKFTSPVPVHVVDGGLERSDSVLNALRFLMRTIHWVKQDVMVHDAARPCLSRKDLDKLLANRAYKEGSILAMPVRDTMKHEQDGYIKHTVERNHLWHALTPQMFTADMLYDALTHALKEGLAVTDEASAIELMGLQPALIEGEASNIKITRPTDLNLAEFFLQQKMDA